MPSRIRALSNRALAVLLLSLAATAAANASDYKTEYAFQGGTDGLYPEAGLFGAGGTLYGTTLNGGNLCVSNDCGVVFSVTENGAEAVVHAFGGKDGAQPLSGVIDVNGTLYGATYAGGKKAGSPTGDGALYEIPSTGAATAAHIFHGGDGMMPSAALTYLDGTLYGTTETGGRYSAGTIFKLTSAGQYKILHHFGGIPKSDGGGPVSKLLDVGGKLFGTTKGGGTGCEGGCGTVFSMTPRGTEKVIYSFAGGADGELPSAGMINVNGTLYGTTLYGGGTGCYGEGCGTIFQITPDGTEKILYAFTGGTDGWFPMSSLVEFDGALFGTTSAGGKYGNGTIFKITLDGVKTIIHAFGNGTDGFEPFSGLTSFNGKLWGTTVFGGTTGGGTVYKITP